MFLSFLIALLNVSLGCHFHSDEYLVQRRIINIKLIHSVSHKFQSATTSVAYAELRAPLAVWFHVATYIYELASKRVEATVDVCERKA